jgi:hypothetical protein
LKRLTNEANHEQTQYKNSSSRFNYFQYAKMLKDIDEGTQTNNTNPDCLFGLFSK